MKRVVIAFLATKYTANKTVMNSHNFLIIAFSLLMISIFCWGIYCLVSNKIPIHYRVYSRQINPVAFWFYIIAFISLPIICLIFIAMTF